MAAQGSGASAPAEGEVPEAEAAEKPVPENGPCRRIFSSGTGVNRFAWCFSPDGSINAVEHPQGKEHTGLYEGYCVWSNGATHGIMRSGGSGNSGLNAPTYPAANKVVHVTSNGVWRIEQTFAQVIATRSINITMKFTNTSGVRQDQLYVTRFIDADMSNTASDDQFSVFRDSITAVQPNNVRLDLLASPVAVGSFIYPSYTPLLGAECRDAAAFVWPWNATGDRAMGLNYWLGDGIAPGASKTLVYTYRVTT